jgi:pimeloyl-ACP methyl ester carboxylesterase
MRRSVVIGLLVVLACAAVAVALPGAGTASRSWDGCTGRVGDVRFRAADGTRLVGHRFGRSRTVVVLAHEFRGNLCDWASYGRRLARLGFEAFAFDFRNWGQSQTRPYRSGQAQGVDVAAAVKLVRAQGAKKVFVVGASLGGSAVLVAGATVRPQVDGIVSVSGAADLAGALGAVPRLRAPVLFVAGKYDTDFAADAQRLYAAAGSTDKTLKILGRGEHGVELVAASPAARTLIERFLRSH